MPGGSLDYGESAEDATLREVGEETGFQVEIERLLVVKTWRPAHVGLYYLCRIIGGTFHPTDEVSAFGYFPLEHLPDVRPVDVNMIKQLSGHALDGGLKRNNGGA